MFLSEFAKYCEKRQQEVGVRITQLTANKYHRLLRYMTEYIKSQYGKDDLFLTQINYEYIDGFNTFLQTILDYYKYTYREILFRLPERQKQLLIAISKEGEARAVTSGEFVQKYRFPSPSSVQAALKGLLEKDFVSSEQGVYRIYDRFFAIWLNENY